MCRYMYQIAVYDGEGSDPGAGTGSGSHTIYRRGGPLSEGVTFLTEVKIMIDTILLNLPVIFMLVVFVGLIMFAVAYFKAFYAARAEKQQKAEEQRVRHGGRECIRMVW